MIRTFDDTTTSELTFNGSSFGQNSNFYLGEDGYLHNSTGTIVSSTEIGKCSRTSGVVHTLITKTAFDAVDYNDAVKYADKKEVTTWGMPDYENSISISSNSASYTAPSNGFISLNGVSASSDNVCKIKLSGQYFATASHTASTTEVINAIWPVSYGDVVYFEHIENGTVKFVPCKGG